MCFILKLKNNLVDEITTILRGKIVPLVAENDIEVVKMLAVNNGKFYPLHSYSRDEYIAGHLYKEVKFLDEDLKYEAQELARIKYHPAGLGLTADQIAASCDGIRLNNGYHSWKQKPNEKIRSGEAYAKFVIPTGTRYFESDNEYISESIKFVEVIALTK